MKSKKVTVNPVFITILSGMTRAELADLAKRAGVKVGKSKKNSLDNLLHAIALGKLCMKTLVTIRLPSNAEADLPGNTIYLKSLYSSGHWTLTSLAIPVGNVSQPISKVTA